MQHGFHAMTVSVSSTLRWLRRVRAAVRRVSDTLALWHSRSVSRRELERVDDRLLRDMGVDRSEVYKPFWRE
jgi:uncharacterized protein YjiS (DUF1127 family)